MPPNATSGLFEGYRPIPGARDELVLDTGELRPDLAGALDVLAKCTRAELERGKSLADRALLHQGVTFSVYSDGRGTEKLFPFDLVPRAVTAREWDRLERGLVQRIRALELFLDDVYGPQRILKAGVVPAELVNGARQHLPVLHGVKPPGGVRIHVAGIDLVRDGAGTFRVLEDNLRCPSGVSYVVENRVVLKQAMPKFFERAQVHRVDHYPMRLADTLRSVAPSGAGTPRMAVLTPGPFNSAYYEHGFLARMMGVDLVQAADLFVDDDRLYARTTSGPARIDVLYRRIDDAFLDPSVFRKDSLLGVPGLIGAWAKGNVALANAPGNGVADDKAVYAFVPQMIRYYLGEEMLLDQVRTYVCLREEDRRYVLDHLGELVVKAVDEAGGYGMLMGPQSSAAERDEFRRRIEADPRRYIAQPRLELSTVPTWDAAEGRMVPRRVDLRPYILNGRDGPWVLPGGLTRVALAPGSYVVNSSQGGGSKDTWVLREGA